MTISETQKQIDTWITTTGVKYFSPLTNLGILMEETGELARLLVREYGEQSYREGAERKDIGDEMADVMWVLCCLANQTGVNLEEAMKKNFEKKTLRDGTRHHNNPKLR